jgi:hypothetical protein
MPDDIGSAPLLVRILYTAAHELGGRRGPDPSDVRDWLRQSRVGQELVTYVAGEGDLLEMAANRLNVSGDEDLRMIGAELAKSAERLRALARTS